MVRVLYVYHVVLKYTPFLCKYMSVFYVNIGKFGVHFGKMWKSIVYIQCVAEIHPIFIRMSEFT